MAKAKNANGPKRITRAEPDKLFPNEWVVFSDPSDNADVTFKDGVVFFHGTDQAKAYRMSGKVEGNVATDFAGEIPYDKHGLGIHDQDEGTHA